MLNLRGLPFGPGGPVLVAVILSAEFDASGPADAMDREPAWPRSARHEGRQTLVKARRLSAFAEPGAVRSSSVAPARRRIE